MLKKWIQPLRFSVQACFMAILILPWLPHPETVANWLFWTVLAVGVFFCGWVCPFGAAQDWLSWIARKLHLPRLQIPWKYQRFLQLSRYIWAALIFFAGVHYAFLNARFYFNDNLFHNMLNWTSGITLSVFLISSLFIDRPFCNYFCMKGAMDGLMSIIRPIGIRRDDKICVHCHLCDKICPMNIKIERASFVRHPNCINCMKCISSCPKDCIRFKLLALKQKKGELANES